MLKIYFILEWHSTSYTNKQTNKQTRASFYTYRLCLIFFLLFHHILSWWNWTSARVILAVFVVWLRHIPYAYSLSLVMALSSRESSVRNRRLWHYLKQSSIMNLGTGFISSDQLVKTNTVICACYPRCNALATALSFPCWIQVCNLFAYKTDDSRIMLPRHVVYPLNKASELQKWYSPSSAGSLQRCLFKALLRFVHTSPGKDRI